MRIVAAPNAFKGSIDAIQAAKAMKKGILAALPDCDVDCVPVADGGDGLTEVMAHTLCGEILEKKVNGPRMKKVSSVFCFVKSKNLAVIEMARASGLALIRPEMYDPARTTTFGTGELIKAALDMGVRQIIIGIGGSATCDGGIGMAKALGYRFLDKNNSEVEPVGGALQDITSIDRKSVDKRLAGVSVTAICDVTNPLTGENGASMVYSPQKGASPAQVIELDRGLENLAMVIKKSMGGPDIKDIPGSGAAGGLGGGLHAFLGAKLKKGIDVVIEIVRLTEKIKGADLVLTSEGRIDFQTKFDKAPAGVAKAAKEAGVPCVAICGSAGDRIDELHEMGINAVFSICSGPMPLESAMSNSFELITRSTEQVLRLFAAGKMQGQSFG